MRSVCLSKLILSYFVPRFMLFYFLAVGGGGGGVEGATNGTYLSLQVPFFVPLLLECPAVFCRDFDSFGVQECGAGFGH